MVQLCQPYLPAADPAYLKAVVALEQERLKKLTDITELTSFFFTDQLEYEASLLVWKKSTPELTKQSLQKLVALLETLEDWTASNLETAVLGWIQSEGLQNGDILWPMRAALSGKKASPPPFAISGVLGKAKTLQRLTAALARLG